MKTLSKISAMILGVALVMALSACASGEAKLPAGSLPAWYADAKSGGGDYYGVGSGRTLATAKAAAANDIAAQLSVSVSSTTDITDSTKDGMLSSKAQSRVSARVADISLPKLETDRQEQIGEMVFVRLKTDARELSKHFGALYKEQVERLNAIAPVCNDISARDFITLKNGIAEAAKLAQIANSVRAGSADVDDMDNAKKILAGNSPRPAIALNMSVSGASEPLFRAAISKELINFYRISEEAQQSIAISVRVSRSGQNLSASVEASITLCGNVVFSAAFSESQKSMDALVNRISVVLYKRIMEWSEAES